MTGKLVVPILFFSALLRAQEPAVPAPPPSPEPNQAYFGQHLQRAMALLDTSSKQRRWPVKVLIYGQSITGSSLLTKMIDTFLRQRYPYADITLENRSIGGFGADRLVRTMEHDLVPYYPDLLIFHVYGGERTGDLERIVSNVRRYTTSDIVLLNHHQNADGKADLEFGPKVLRYLAQKYDCELVDVTANWPRYLEENHFPPNRMLRDNVHPNPDGLALLTTLIGRHLQFNPLSPSPSGMTTVRWYEARRPLEEGGAGEITFSGAPWKPDTEGAIGESSSSSLRLQFDGNRIDAIEAHTKAKLVPGTAKILIDGKPPSQNPRLYAVTLPSRGPETWFPCIRRVRFDALPLVEDWTLKITGINEDATRFRCQVTGSKTGPDGEGSSTENFISKSRRVVIESRDWMLADIMKIFKQKTPPPVGYEVKWSVVPQFTDIWKPEPAADSARVYATTLAQGLTNGPHTLELIPNGDGPLPVEALQVYRPPMK